MGNRIGQTITTGDTKSYTWYVRDAQGNILSTYTSQGGINNDVAGLDLKYDEVYMYGSSRLGSYSIGDLVNGGPDPRQYYAGSGIGRGNKRYELTNHLGNVLAVISDRKFGISSGNSSLIDHYEPHIVSAQDYYPFGMISRVVLPGSGKTYRFGFNGKMNDNEVKGLGNQQDYGMRIYDPRVGRFLSVDPISKSYPWYTPYQFAGNSPIQATDLDGLEEYHYTMTLDKQGVAHLSKPTVREFQDHNILGIHFKTKITPERYIVTFQGKNYYIGYAGTMKGWGNEWGRKLFQLWRGDGNHVNAQMFTYLFYNEEDSKRGKLVDEIESMRRYMVTGAKDAMVMQILGIPAPLRYKLGKNDEDWRGTDKTFQEAKEEAFKKTGVNKEEFEVTKWGKDKYGKSIPVEYRAKNGAEVSIDNPHASEGPDAPHVGWQTGGKRGSGGAQRGHIILDAVPAGRSNVKE